MPVTVRVRLLGEFEVRVDGVPVPSDAWTRRHASALVKRLALADGHRLHREQVIEDLWPGLPVEEAAPRLHKAAHFARKALGLVDAVVLRQELVLLLPSTALRVDVEEFARLGREAQQSADPAAVQQALEAYGGELLADARYEEWADAPRETVRQLHLALLRQDRRWEEILAVEPADEQAHLELARALAERRDLRGALRQLDRLDHALMHELGTTAGPEATELRARLERAARSPDRDVRPAQPAGRRSVRLVERREIEEAIRDTLDRADSGRGGPLVLAGPPGVGKSVLLSMAERIAVRRGWRTGRGSASAIEGPWPYAPVLEALADLCRQHPALLDGLDDVYREEINRALAGSQLEWSGESAHQRLFVAAAELARLAATGHGLLLVVDDVHDADEASMRLLHYIARCAAREPIVVALAHRPMVRPGIREVLTSLLARSPGARIEVPALSERGLRRLLAEASPELTDDAVTHVWRVSAGVPFTALELARAADPERPGDVLPPLPDPVRRTFERVALLGTAFTIDELLAVGEGPEEEVYAQLEAGLGALLVEPADPGFRFRHPLIREVLVDRMAPYDRVRARVLVAERLDELGAPPSRVAHQLIEAGLLTRAAPYVLRATETAGALGAYRDALAMVDAVREHASETDRAHLLARRGDLLLALGEPSAVEAYSEALPITSGTEHRLVRARLARAACFSGDFEAAEGALAGLGLEDDRADPQILMARGHLAYFVGDSETAWNVACQARELLHLGDDAWQMAELVSLQGLIAHQRGEWFERFRLELRRTQGKERLAVALFDAHLCVAEYVLYGPVPYAELIEQTEGLRTSATRSGALRGIAFATALIGEAALLGGDLDRAERELTEAAELHRDIDARSGESHSLQRLAEVRLLQGDKAEARRLLEQALPLARWSAMGMHLLQRLYGTLIKAAPDLEAARAVLDRAMATLDENDHCIFCDVMLEVPAAILCADLGELDEASRHLAAAEASAAHWSGTAWQAAVLEARAHLVAAQGDTDGSARLWARAAGLFEAAGQPRDAARCRAGLAPGGLVLAGS
jgi:DNA-binding SARP family transcriptional activator/tetratricopeptide (TPR) repeat protein